MFKWRSKPNPFILLSALRTGSNYLLGLLEQHHQVHAFYELFQSDPESRIAWQGTEFEHSPQVSKFLNLRYHSSYGPLVKTVGFKFVSLQAALESQNWIERSITSVSDSARQLRLEISESDFIRFLTNQDELRERAHSFFPNKDILTISYEELVKSKVQTLTKVLKFLHLRKLLFAWMLRDSLRKQRLIPVREQVTNYCELKNRLLKTEYNRFFPDGI